MYGFKFQFLNMKNTKKYLKYILIVPIFNTTEMK